MRHRKAYWKLNRKREHRKATFRNMLTALFERGQIETTITKAKALRPVAERMITLARRNTLHAKKIAFSVITKQEVVRKLFDTIAPSFKDRPGGYTRIIRTHVRRGDAAEMALIELVGTENLAPVLPSGKGEKDEKAAKAAKKGQVAKTPKVKAPKPEKKVKAPKPQAGPKTAAPRRTSES